MRTLIVILLGVAAMFICIAVAAALSKRLAGKSFDGAMIFIWLWLAFVVVDCGVGVGTGHGLVMELVLHALMFALPAGLAWYLSRQHRSTHPAVPRQE